MDPSGGPHLDLGVHSGLSAVCHRRCYSQLVLLQVRITQYTFPLKSKDRFNEHFDTQDLEKKETAAISECGMEVFHSKKGQGYCIHNKYYKEFSLFLTNSLVMMSD